MLLRSRITAPGKMNVRRSRRRGNPCGVADVERVLGSRFRGNDILRSNRWPTSITRNPG